MKYFSIQELTKSSVASRKGIKNIPTQEVEKNLEALVDKILDPLREAYGKPIKVNSGYRSPAVNRAVGGSGSSQHLTGQAVDIEDLTCSGKANKELFNLLIKSGLPFDQVIWEFTDSSGCPEWVHVSYGPKNRRQVLIAKKNSFGKTVYETYRNS